MELPFLESLLGKLRPGRKSEPKVSDSLAFASSEHLTLGVELELQIVDATTFVLAPRCDEILARLAPDPHFVPELFKPILEINGSIQRDAHGVARELGTLTAAARDAASALGCRIAANGCHPTAAYEDTEIRDTGRYGRIVERNQWLLRRWIVCGMHIHMGMVSPDRCMRFLSFFENLIPHLLALSSSSPFWHGTDTGLASCRPVMSEALPTASLLHVVHTWDDFCNLVHRLERAEAISSLKDLWWDLRPSPKYGTLELRIFDQPTNLKELRAIVAFVHALALWFSAHGEWVAHMTPPPLWLARENKWRAMRYGLGARIITSEDGSTTALRDDIGAWLGRTREIFDAQGYADDRATIQDILTHGAASDRMRAVWAATGHMEDVIAHTIREFETGAPIVPIPAARPGAETPERKPPAAG